MMNKLAIVAISAGLLAGCGSTPAQQQTITVAAGTLAAIAAQNNTTVDKIVTEGQLFCQLNGGTSIVAVVTAAGAPVNVTGKTAEVVANACNALNAIPVPPPANPGTVSTVASQS